MHIVDVEGYDVRCGYPKNVVVHPSIRSKSAKYRFSIAFRELALGIFVGGDTSAHVTTKPEKNIFGSGEKLRGFCRTFLVAEISIHRGYMNILLNGVYRNDG